MSQDRRCECAKNGATVYHYYNYETSDILTVEYDDDGDIIDEEFSDTSGDMESSYFDYYRCSECDHEWSEVKPVALLLWDYEIRKLWSLLQNSPQQAKEALGDYLYNRLKEIAE